MSAGDCFFGILPRSGTIKHYWVVLCEPCPEGMVAVVNFTTPSGAPKAHICTQASFPTLKYDSEVAWMYAAVVSSDAIKKALDAKLFEPQTGMDKTQLDALIRSGIERGVISRAVLKKIVR